MELQPVLEQRAKVEEFTRKHGIGLLTLLFTDLVGSTKLKQELGDREAVALLQSNARLICSVIFDGQSPFSLATQMANRESYDSMIRAHRRLVTFRSLTPTPD